NPVLLCYLVPSGVEEQLRSGSRNGELDFGDAYRSIDRIYWYAERTDSARLNERTEFHSDPDRGELNFRLCHLAGCQNDQQAHPDCDRNTQHEASYFFFD